MKVRVPTNLVGGISFFSISIVLVILIPKQIPIMAFFQTTNINSRFVPYILSGIIFLLSMILIIQSLVFKKEQYLEFDLSKEMKGLLYILILILFVFLVKYIGFLISSILMGAGTLAFLKVKAVKTYAIVLISILVLNVLFVYAFNIPLPKIGAL